jgi:hypothetical protein
MKSFLREEHGGTLAFLALFLSIAVAMGALVIDIGQLYFYKATVQDKAEAVALAAVQDILNGAEEAERVGREYADKNLLTLTSIVANETEKTVTVEAETQVTFYFAGIFGLEGETVKGKAKVKMGATKGGTGFLPLGIVKSNFAFGKEYTLKYVATQSQQGNFGSLALGGTGGSNYENNLRNGYSGFLNTGDKLDTETGNKQGPTRQGLEARISTDASRLECQDVSTADKSCGRVLYIPIIDSLDLNGRKQVEILGFASFYMSELESGPQLSIKGKFVKMVYPGEMSDDTEMDNGLYSLRLIY